MIFNRSLRNQCCLAFSLALATLSAQAETTAAQTEPAVDYFRQFANVPVPVQNHTGGANQTLYLVSIEDGDLMMRYSPDDRREIGIPLNTAGLRIHFEPGNQIRTGMEYLRDDNFRDAVHAMRPAVYPLLRFVEVPAANFNIHPVVERFVHGLVRADGLESEAVNVVSRLPMDRLTPEFWEHGLFLANKLVDQGRNRDALRILNAVPLSEDQEDFMPLIIRFANQLRKQGNIEEALFIYQRLQDLNIPVAPIAQLWTAYCNLEMGRSQTARILLNQSDQMGIDDPGFSLRRLIQAKIYLQENNVFEALRAATEGVVYVDVGYDWAPELIFTTAYAYELNDNPDVAREIYRENALFFPDNPWVKRGNERKAALPPPTEKPAAEET